MPNLVSLIRPCLQILRKTQSGGISDILISGQSLTNENCHNSGTSNYIDMKLGPVKYTWQEKRQRHSHFSDLWPIWSNLEDRFRSHGLENLHFH